MSDSLGDRLKNSYENVWRYKLPNRMPLILRLDGKSFSTITKQCKRPFDDNFIQVMNFVGIELCKEIQGAQIAYLQSDEISILIKNYQEYDTQPYLGNNLQKMVSVSAGIASSFFTLHSSNIFGKIKTASFDCRAFVLPKEEVNNTMLWRQQDATRNSISMLAQSLYSHKELFGKNSSELQELTFQKGCNWNDLPTHYRRGRCIVKKIEIKESINSKTKEKVNIERGNWCVDNEIPIFSQDKNYIERYI